MCQFCTNTEKGRRGTADENNRRIPTLLVVGGGQEKPRGRDASRMAGTRTGIAQITAHVDTGQGEFHPLQGPS
jgi:hypothetical protein